jgi:hypothetical protein
VVPFFHRAIQLRWLTLFEFLVDESLPCCSVLGPWFFHRREKARYARVPISKTITATLVLIPAIAPLDKCAAELSDLASLEVGAGSRVVLVPVGVAVVEVVGKAGNPMPTLSEAARDSGNSDKSFSCHNI